MDKLKAQIANYTPTSPREIADKEVFLEFLNVYGDKMLTRHPLGHLCASAFITNRDHNKVLIINHLIMRFWMWPGGHLDGETDALSVAVREAEEETGIKNLKVLIPDIAGMEVGSVSYHIKRGKEISAHVHLNLGFLLEADEREPLTVKLDENSGVKWVTFDDLIAHSEATNSNIGVYQIYIKKLKNLE